MSGLLSRAIDRLVASDPGLSRLRMGLAGAVCVCAVLGVEFLVGTAMHLPPASLLISMMLGCVVAMIGANALARPSARHSIRAAIFFPVAIGVGLGIGTLVGHLDWLSRLTFVAVMFAAVFVRRFGLDFFFYGFLAWMGFFFALFLRPQPGQLPELLLAVTVGTVVVLALCTTVFRPHPQRTLARIFASMRARRNGMLRTMSLRLLARSDKDREKWTRRILEERTDYNEMVLMSDGWAANARALPVGWSAESLRRSLLDGQLSLDLIGSCSRSLLTASPRVRGLASRALVLAAEGEADRARRVCALLTQVAAREGEGGGTGAVSVRQSVAGLVDGIQEVLARPAQPHLPPVLEPNPEFTPAAALTGLGQLPGAASVAKDVTARGGRWNPVVRWNSTTRQAVQVTLAGGLAIVAGTLVSGQRYYWAVIAAFVVFTGTGSRMDSFGKSLNRVVGTLFGLGVGILLAALTAGDPVLALVVIVLCVFLGFYLIRISYAYMMFFVTILLAQLYGILGQFSDALLVLRLVETAVGAAIGMLVALLVTPVSTSDTVRNAQQEITGSMGELMAVLGQQQRDPDSVRRPEIDALLFAISNAQRRHALAAAPLTRYYLRENRPRRMRRRLSVVASCLSAARTVTHTVMVLDGPHPRVADACDEVARLARSGPDEEFGEVPAASDTPTASMRVLPITAADGEADVAEQTALGAITRLARNLQELRSPGEPARLA